MYSEYIDSLREQGFYFSDNRKTGHSRAKVEHYIPIIGFPRFRDYVYPFKTIAANQPDNVGVDNVLRLYRFDRKLRMITLDAIERIEISLKHKVGIALLESFGPAWHADQLLLNSTKDRLYENIQMDLKRTQIWKSLNKRNLPYSDYPADRILDAVSFGRMEILYSMLPSDRKVIIASDYNVKTNVFATWIKSMRDIRNAAAHQARLWNGRYRVEPKIPTSVLPLIGDISENYEKRFYGYAIIMNLMIEQTARNSQWKLRLRSLIEEHNIEHLEIKKIMGFPYDWWENPIWKLSDQINS